LKKVNVKYRKEKNMIKIMIVEDDRSLREIYSVRLAAEGYSIVSAGDGEEALGVVIREKPDLIISDVMMPKISGFDMLDILRSTPETKDIKVIMMTALSGIDQKERGEKLGADRYLVKSQVGIEDVVRTVHEVLNDTPSNDGAANIAVANVIAGGVEPTLPAFEPTPVSTAPAPATVPLPPLEPTATVSMPPQEPIPAPQPVQNIAVAPAGATEEPLSPTAASILSAPITPMPSANTEEPTPVTSAESAPVISEPTPVANAEPTPVASAEPALAEPTLVADAPTPAVAPTTEPLPPLEPTPEVPAPPVSPVMAEPAPVVSVAPTEPVFPFPTLQEPTVAPNIDGSERSETVIPVDTAPNQSDMEAQIASELGGK
jgi:CheY-like chemotaxis protein